MTQPATDLERLTYGDGARRHLLAALVVTLACAVAWTLFDPMAQFFAFGVAASLVVTAPMLRPGYQFAEPWTFLALTVYLGHGVRGLFISLYGDDDADIQQLFLLHKPPDFFVYPNFVYLGALVLMALAYVGVTNRRRPPVARPVREFQFGRQVDLVIAMTAGVGLLGAALFIQSSGGFSLDSLSAKRTTIPGLDLRGYEGGHGVFRTLAQFSNIALMLAVARLSVTHGHIPAGTGRWFWVVLLFLNSAIVPIYASTRADIVYPVVGALVVRGCLGRRHLRIRTVVQSGAILFVLLAVLTFLRSTSEGGASEVTGQAATDAVAQTLVLNRNFGELPVTAHIMDAVPGELDYTYGETVLTYVAGPIPRSIWPDKPLVSPGPLIGTQVYGLARTGVPPGAVGEFYWAFGLPGVIIGSLGLGLLLRLINRRFNPVGADPQRVLLYAAGLLPLAINTMAVSLGYALLTSALALVMMLAVITLARGRVRSSGPLPSHR